MSKHVYWVVAVAQEGRETEFNAFYDEHHVPDVMTVPGFVGCRRLKLAQNFASGEGAAAYAAIYEMDTDDAPGAIAELRRRMAAGAVRSNPYSQKGKGVASLYDIIFETQLS